MHVQILSIVWMFALRFGSWCLKEIRAGVNGCSEQYLASDRGSSSSAAHSVPEGSEYSGEYLVRDETFQNNCVRRTILFYEGR